MKIEGYEEISEKEYRKLPVREGIGVINQYENKTRYYKKAQKFPIVFEDEHYEVQVAIKYLNILHKCSGENFYFHINHSLPILVKAVEKAKEVMNKNV